MPIDDDAEMVETDFERVNFFEEGVAAFNIKTLGKESMKDESVSVTIERVLGNRPNNLKEMSKD